MTDPFHSYWDDAAVLLDDSVDTILGDRIRYKRAGLWLGDGDQGSATIPGFVIADVANVGGTEGYDETLGSRWRVKIATAIIGTPVQGDRIQHPKLGTAIFRPAGGLPEEQGRYVTFDIEKASA